MQNPTSFAEFLAGRIAILDGAMGTMVQRHRLDEAAFRGARFADHPRDLKGNNDLLVLTRPDVIKGIHGAFLDAGADIIETNTFNSTSISQADYGLEALVPELNTAAARLVHEAIAEYRARSGDQGPKFVAGVLGPTNRTASVSPDVNDPGFRNIDFETLRVARTNGGNDETIVWVADGVPTPIRILQREDGEDAIDLRLIQYQGQ